MPIRINLLAEEKDLRKEKLKDPQLIGFVIGGGISLVVTLFALTSFLASQKLAHHVHKNNLRWAQNEKKFKELSAKQGDSILYDREIESLQRYTTNRFLWSPVLNDLQFSLVPNIYLARLTAEQSLRFEAEKKNGNVTIPAQVTESVRLYIKGFDTSPDGNSSINIFKAKLLESPELRKFFVPSSGGEIQLSDVSTRRTNPVNTDISYVDFTLLCKLTEKVHK